MPLVLLSNGADGYDMDYTDSKSIRTRSQVCTRLGWNPLYDSLNAVSAVSHVQQNSQNYEILLQCGLRVDLHDGCFGSVL